MKYTEQYIQHYLNGRLDENAEVLIIETIERYLTGEMEGAERVEFDQNLAENNSLKQALQQIKAIQWTIENQDIIRLNRKLQTASQQKSTFEFTQRNVGYKWKTILAAASILIGLGVLYFMFSPTEGERYFAEYFKPYSFKHTKEGNPMISASEHEDKIDAIQAYEKEEYDKAYKIFSQLEAESMFPQEYQLYKGVIALQKDDISLAISNLKYACEHELDIYSKENFQAAHWYLALAYVKDGTFKEARPLLEQLTSFVNPYQQLSKELLKDI